MKHIVNKNDIVELEIVDIGANGEGIGKYKGYTLFVNNALVGDLINVKVIKTNKNYGYARITEIIRESAYRVEPKCPIADKCGGCQIQQLDYKKQLEFKENKVINCLNRIGGFRDINMEPICGMDDPYYYRNKSQVPVGKDKDGEINIGFYAKRTHSIIDTDHCYIGSKINNDIIALIRNIIIKYNIEPYDEIKHKGLLRHILTRTGHNTGQIMVCLIINGNDIPNKDILIDELLKAFPNIKSICLNINKEKSNVILGEKIKVLWGEPYIIDSIGDVKYRISPLSFYQVNSEQTKNLYDIAMEYADLKGDEIVWDLYCGIGTISLYLAQKAKYVYGVEIVAEAIEDAKYNAKMNNISNAEFFVGAAEEVLPELYKERGIKADVIIVDPPRKGCDEVLLDTIIEMKPKKLVYVSCDPATLARDLKYLAGQGFELVKVRAVDQFCHSVHVESIILMTYCGSGEK